MALINTDGSVFTGGKSFEGYIKSSGSSSGVTNWSAVTNGYSSVITRNLTLPSNGGVYSKYALSFWQNGTKIIPADTQPTSTNTLTVICNDAIDTYFSIISV
jgi:hypothetical protein